MTHEEFERNIHGIDPRLTVDNYNNVFIDADNYLNYLIYDFRHDEYNSGTLITYIPDKFDAIEKVIDAFKGAEVNMPNKNKLIKKLRYINPSLKLEWSEPYKKAISIYWLDKNNDRCLIYDFGPKEYNFCYVTRFLSIKEMEELQELVKNYFYYLEIEQDFEAKKKATAEANPFWKYTDHLAETLLEKKKAYGDSFTQSVDDYGLKVIGIRLSDKYNRIKHLVNSGELKENDESLKDTLLDNAGYSILALKYLKEHKKC